MSSCAACAASCSAFFVRSGQVLCPRCWVDAEWPGKVYAQSVRPAWHHVPCRACGYFNPDEMTGEPICPLCRAQGLEGLPPAGVDREPPAARVVREDNPAVLGLGHHARVLLGTTGPRVG